MKKHKMINMLSLVWLIIFSLIGLSFFLETPKQIEKDKIFVDKNLKPSVLYIEKFKNDSLRLPSKKEYYYWERFF